MAKQRLRVFSFKEIEGGHKAHLNGYTAFYFSETYGFPLEMYVEEMENWMKRDPRGVVDKLFEEWVEFVTENKIENPKFLGTFWKETDKIE